MWLYSYLQELEDKSGPAPPVSMLPHSTASLQVFAEITAYVWSASGSRPATVRVHLASTEIVTWYSMSVRAQSLSCVLLFATPWTVACQAPLSMGFSRQEYWSELAFPAWGDLLDPGIELASLTSPTLAGGSFTMSATWEASQFYRFWQMKNVLNPPLQSHTE